MKTIQYKPFRSLGVSHFEAMGSARTADIERVERTLRGGVSVILAAHAGMGKSYVATLLVERLGQGDGARGPVIRCGLTRDLRLLRSLLTEQTDDATIVTVEDAHLLGIDDLRELVDLVSARLRPVLITVDTATTTTHTPESVERARILTALWTELGLERIDLSGIGFAEAVTIVDDVTGGDALDIVTRARIIRGAAGNPQLVAELAREAAHNSGVVCIDVASLVLGPISLSPRILDLTRARLVGMNDAEEYALVTLARTGTVPYMRATRLVGQAPLRSLLRRGLVSHESGALEFVSANVVYASAAQASRSTENPLEEAHAVERVLVREYLSGQGLTPRETMMVAAALLVEPDLESVSPEAAARLFTLAARQADRWGNPAAAEIFARGALAREPSIAATEEYSRALADQGSLTAARDVLERCALPHDDHDSDVDFFGWWMMLLAWTDPSEAAQLALVERARAWGTMPRVLDEWQRLIPLRERLRASAYADGEQEMRALAADVSISRPIRLRALAELIVVHTTLGQPDALRRVTAEGEALLDGVRQSTLARDSSDAHTAGVVFVSNAGFARAIVGPDRTGFPEELDSWALSAISMDDNALTATVSMISGSLNLGNNRLAAAVNDLSKAEKQIAHSVEPNIVVVMRQLRGMALVNSGRADEARALVDDVSTEDRDVTSWSTFFGTVLETLLAADPCDLEPTRGALLTVAAREPNKHNAFTALYMAFVNGAPADTVVAALDSLTATGESEFADAVEMLLRAAVGADAFGLDEAGADFERTGWVPESVHAYIAAAELHLAQGRAEQAATSRMHAGRLSCATTTTTAEPSHVANGKVATLTRRELEIARLAGTGMSNAQIATRLFLSVRTVESHVLQARVKLGASRRSELGHHLAEFQTQAS